MRYVWFVALLMGGALWGDEPTTNRLELWNAREYAAHSAGQETHFKRFFDYNSLFGSSRVLDIGSGDGRLTALLAKYLKTGQVIGIDYSHDMIQHASREFPKEAYPNLSFEQQTAQNFHFDEPFDYIVSIHTLHWVKEQSETLKNIYNHLRPGGKVFFLLAPSKEGLPFDRALKATLKEWDTDFKDFKSNQNFFDTETYRKLLIDAGFHVEGIHYIFTEQLHDDRAALSQWLKQWLPYYKKLPVESKDRFLTQLVTHYLDLSGNTKPGDPIVWSEYVLIINASKQKT